MSFPRIFRTASSWWMTALLAALLCGAYIYFRFGDSPFPRWTDFLFRRPPGILLYSALVLNLAAATIRTVLKGLATPVPHISGIKEMDSSAAVCAGGQSLDRAAELMRSRGFSPRMSGGGLVAVRGRYSFLPGTVFRSGLVLLMSALLLSAHLREAGDAVFREGDRLDLLGAATAVGKIEANLPEDYFRVGEEGGFRLDDVSATASIGGGRYTLKTSFATRAAGRYYRITHLGFVLPVTVRTGRTASAKDAYLDVLPPGRTDTVSLEGAAVTFSLHPERTISKGILKGEQFNLTNPFFHINAKVDQDSRQAEARLRAGESATSGDLSTVLGKTSLYVKVQAVRDPALPWVYLGLFIASIGLASMLSRFFWYRRELAAMEQDGMVFMGYHEEFFKKWGIQNFLGWVEASGAGAEPAIAEGHAPGRQQNSPEQGP